jgi:hypothetical protein
MGELNGGLGCVSNSNAEDMITVFSGIFPQWRMPLVVDEI